MYLLLPSQVVNICDLQRLALCWFHAPGMQLDNEVSQSTDQLHAPSATSTMVTGPVREYLQAGTVNAPVLDRPVPLRRLRDSDAGYKYPDLLTSLLTYFQIHSVSPTILASIHLLIHLSTHLCHHPHSRHPSLLRSFTPGSKPTFSTNPSNLRFLLPTASYWTASR